ncbi:hypothetical protein ACQJBY_067349 [Aegilops geniculata]
MATVLPFISALVSSINLVSTLGKENQRLQGKIKGTLQRLLLEVELAVGDMPNYEGDEQLTLQMQELLLDIQDFLCDLLIPEKPAALVQSAMGTDSRPEDIERIEAFLLSIKSIKERQEARSKQVPSTSKGTSLPSAESTSKAAASGTIHSSSASTPYVAENYPHEGFPNTKNEIMELLSPAQGAQLRLISIVGCGGLGKSALAGAVYEAAHINLSPPTPNIRDITDAETPPPATEIQETTAQLPPPPATEIQETVAELASPPATEIFNCKAWIAASVFDDKVDLLNEILDKFGLKAADGNTSKALQSFLRDKRYLVIIDDLRSNRLQWKDIEHVFPENLKGSRIIVTTTVHSIAEAYSSGYYYVYPMQCLGEADSKELFWNKVFGHASRPPNRPEQERSETILSKCDGLPLALISAGKYLSSEPRKSHLSEETYQGVCQELDNIVASAHIAFDEMKTMFVQCYNNLTDDDHKNCLLYLSIYPRGNEINSKNVVRRLEAEQLVKGDALKCWNRLIDNSMIEPAPIRSYHNVAKKCKVQGMMMEFAIHKAVSRNLVTLVEEGDVRRNKPDKKVRRLSVRSSSSTREQSKVIPYEIELSTVRSLTIHKSKHPAETYVNSVDFKTCKLMRVLDLEGCKGLNRSSSVLVGICDLLFLNYLSLKNTDVDELPTEMQNLVRLVTLDIRQTMVMMLPVEIIMLPNLALLYGEFELPPLAGTQKEKVTEFLKEESKLQTLAGIIIKNTGSFEIVIQHATKLKKVKVCGLRDTYAASASTPVPSQLGTNNTAVAAATDQRTPVQKSTTWFVKKNVAAYAPRTPEPKSTFGIGACFGFGRMDRHTSNGRFVNAPNERSADQVPRATQSADLVPRGELVKVLLSSLQERSTSLDSICIDSGIVSNHFIASNPKPCIVRSIKLRGPLRNLTPGKLNDLCNLKKLHLSLTRLSSKQLVEALQELDHLERLKLTEEDTSGSWDGIFSVPSGGFSALRVLCFEGSKKYPYVKIAENAMSLLASLQLLCLQSPPPTMGAEATQLPRPLTEAETMEHEHPLTRVQGIKHLECLDEVMLHHSADDATVRAWKEAATKHTNMPCVKKLPAPAQPIINAA